MSSRDAASTGTRKCYVCGKAGHMSKDCTEQPKAGKAERAPKPAAAAAAPAAAAPAAARPADSSASASSGTRKCYHCGQAGHKASECDQAPKDGARAKPKEKDEPSFKERLEAYKASNPEPGKKNFCYLCGKEGHRERDCPKNSKKKDEDKTCLRCGEADHIARYCPTIANRTVYRNEEKARKAGCYICEEEGHHAEECPQLAVLAEEFDKFVSKLDSGMKLNVKVWNVLLRQCARALELNGALYLYEQMRTRNVEPTEETMKHLEYLHDRSGKDQSKLTAIPMKPKRVSRLREIVAEWKHRARAAAVEETFLPHIVAHLRDNPAARAEAESCKSMFDLAKMLRGASIASLDEPLSALAARTALATLKGLGRYHQKGKGAEFDLDGSLDKPGKFAAKKEAAAAAANGAAASGKKKQKSNKKKSSSTKKAKDGESDGKGEGDEKKKAKAKATKRKEPSASSKKDSAADGDVDMAAEDADTKPAAKKQKAAKVASVKKETTKVEKKRKTKE